MVGDGQVTAPGFDGGQFGAVAAEDVGQYGDRLARLRYAGTRCGLGGGESLLFAPDAVVAPEFGGGPGAWPGVGGACRGGEDVGEVGVGAAGHSRVEALPVFGAGEQRNAGVHSGALGGVPGDCVGKIGCLVPGVAEGPAGEAPLASSRVGAEHPADHDAAAGDGLDPQHVTVGQGSAGFACLEVVIVGPADDQVPGRGLGAIGDADGRSCVDAAEVDQVLTNPGGQLAAASPVGGHQQHTAAGKVAGDVGAGGLVHGLVGRGAADAAVLIVVVERGGVAGAEPQGGGTFPGGGEPDRLGELD